MPGIQSLGAELSKLMSPLASGITSSYSWLVTCGSQLASGRAEELLPMSLFVHRFTVSKQSDALQLSPSIGGGVTSPGSVPTRFL